jgi:hypothetical protein
LPIIFGAILTFYEITVQKDCRKLGCEHWRESINGSHTLNGEGKAVSVEISFVNSACGFSPAAELQSASWITYYGYNTCLLYEYTV